MIRDISGEGDEQMVSLITVKGSGMLRSRRYTPSPSPSPSAASVDATSDASSSESEEADVSLESNDSEEGEERSDEDDPYESFSIDDLRGFNDASDVETFYSLFESIVCFKREKEFKHFCTFFLFLLLVNGFFCG